MSLDRITAHITTTEQNCWLWDGAIDKKETAFPSPMLRLSNPRRLVSARRYAYEAHNQVSVPSDYIVTAICKNSLCVNPVHLTAQKRGKQGFRQIGEWKVEHCKRGHEFSPWNTGKQPKGRFCIACDKARRRENMRRWRETNLPYEKSLRDTRRKKKQALVNSLKKCCAQCGEPDQSCLDFHHLDPTSKHDTVANLIYGQASNDMILTEIEKCIVLCANCHRKLHAQERSE